MTILVIEDDVKIAQLIKQGLEMENHALELSHDGRDGLEKAKTNKYDMILLDIMLPEINGFDVCRTLRREKIETPVIMLTAKDTEEDRLTGMKAGADDYVTKPFSFSDLTRRIYACQGRKKTVASAC